MKKIISVAIALMVLSSCTSIDKEFDGRFSLRNNHISRFYATTEQSGAETKVYADEDLKVLWNAGDLLSVFNQRTYNSKFEFKGEDGDNAGDFEDVTPSGLHSGNALDNIYAVYPYASGNKINNAGNTITLTLPAEQQYKAHSFGIGANTMVAVTNDSYLAFKNLCGYLQLRLYGDNVKVSSIKIQGNNGEKIAGRANVAVGLGTLPTVTMDETATDAITLVCDPPVQLGTTAEQYKDFWFVIPPVTFEGGFTVTVTDELGGVFQKTTTKSLAISRSTIEWMTALEVTPNYDNTNVVFEDANFKAYCVENFDKDNDGEISRQEALLVTSMTVNPEVVASLKGIECFTNLQSLDCRLQWSYATFSGDEWLFYRDDNAVFSLLTSLDLSSNTALTSLLCSSNSLTSLDVSKNTALTVLLCDFNKLSSLDISHNTALTNLSCSDNQLTSLDVSHMSGLTNLGCSSNQLKSIDVSHNPSLKSLYCHSCQLTCLDLSYNTKLTNVGCDNNQLLEINVSNNVILKWLSCINNQLSSIDVSNNTALTNFNCRSNKADMVIYVKGGQLFDSFIHDDSVIILEKGNPIPDGNIIIDDLNFKSYCVQYHDKNSDGEISYAEALQVTSIDCPSYHIQSLSGIEHFKNLTFLACYSNLLSTLDVSDNVALTELNCGDNHLTNLDVSNNTSLTGLDCGGNQLTNIDVRNNTALTYIGCADNQLTSIEVDNNVSLIWLDCADNQLTSIDISNNLAMTHLDCRNNQLTSLNVGKNTALTELWCGGNQLTTLDISKNTTLKELRCQNNQLTTLDVSHNTALTWLWCYNNPNLVEIWLKTGQTINDFQYDTWVATIKRKD